MAATVEGQVIAGTVDRLLVGDNEVMVVDFKTARRPPKTLDEVPVGTVRQMSAYVAALEVIYPERAVRVGVLYTQTPQLFELPQELIRLHKNAFAGADESYSSKGVE